MIRCSSPERAIEGAQTIMTCTADKQYATVLTDNMLGTGVHIDAIGGDCPGKTELHQDVLLRSDIFVEYPPQTGIEGEIQQLEATRPSQSSGGLSPVKAQAAQRQSKSPCSAAQDLRSKILAPCGMYARRCTAPPSYKC